MNIKTKKLKPVHRAFCHRPLLILAVLAAVLLSGCASAPNPVYYRVDYNPEAGQPTIGAGRLVLKVDGLDSTQPLTQHNIVHRLSETSMVFEPYNLWEAAPVDLARRALVAGLRKNGFFKRVTTKRLSIDDDLTLRARLERFEWVTMGDTEQAQVYVSFELYDETSDKVIYSGQARNTVKADGKTTNAVARAMTKALEETIGQVISQTVAQSAKFLN